MRKRPREWAKEFCFSFLLCFKQSQVHALINRPSCSSFTISDFAYHSKLWAFKFHHLVLTFQNWLNHDPLMAQLINQALTYEWINLHSEQLANFKVLRFHLSISNLSSLILRFLYQVFKIFQAADHWFTNPLYFLITR